MFRVVTKSNRHDVEIALPIDRRQPAETLAPQILYLLWGKSAHFFSNRIYTRV
jgi:hypothetical protein